MRLLTAFACVLLATTSAVADRAPPAKAAKVAKGAKGAKATEPAKPACKRKVIGRGLERKVVCEFEAPVVVRSEQPKPKVLIVPRDGRSVVGRPKQTDPLAGLSRRLR